jgi:ATP-dependent DNA helicase RecG
MRWTSERIRTTLADMRAFGDDFTLIEAKEAGEGLPDNLPETVCAFANMPQGGTILLGVSQRQNFSVTGVRSPNDMIQAVTSQTREAVTPAPHIESYAVPVDGRTVVVVDVTALAPSEKPAEYKGEAYLRQADGDYRMNSNDHRMIDVEALHDSERVAYDLTAVPGTSVADLDQELLTRYLASVRAGSRRLREATDQDICRLLSVTTPAGELTTAGLYALGFYPQGKQPALAVTAAVRLPRDGSGARTQNRRDFDGPLPALLEEIQEWIMANTGTSDTYRADGHMVRRPEFPPRAVRELVANALVHRDLGPNTLGTGDRIQVRVTPENLIITSPGGLRGLSVRELESDEHTQKAVNQRLYEMAKHLTTDDGAGVIEGEGGGIREALAETRDADLHRPQFFDNGVKFTVLLRRGSVFSPSDLQRISELAPDIRLSHIQKVLLLSLSDGDPWNITRMCDEFSPLSRTEAQNQVDGLIRQGLVTQTAAEITLIGGESPSGRASSGTSTVSTTPASPPPQTPTNSPVPPRADTVDRDELRAVTRNGPAVMASLDSDAPVDVRTIAHRAGLSVPTTRYAINRLIDAGLIEMVGGQGQHDTGYRRRSTGRPGPPAV